MTSETQALLERREHLAERLSRIGKGNLHARCVVEDSINKIDVALSKKGKPVG